MSKIKVQEDAVKYVKDNAKELIKKYADPVIYHGSNNPEAIFMAGCPGAGKTEYARGLKIILEKDTAKRIVHIDADQIKEDIPGYTGARSYLYQGASSLGVQKILDHVYKNKQDFILDGRFSQEKLARQNIRSALKRNYRVVILYVYQNPTEAWKWTKMREDEDGRVVPKEIFVNGLFDSIRCTEKMKTEFGNKLELDIIIKNYANTGTKKIYFNTEQVENYVKLTYNPKTLMKEII